MNDNHVAILLEDIQGKLVGLAEAASITHNRLDKLEANSDKILEIVEDLYPVKVEVTDQSDELADHEMRLQKLEMPQRA